MLTNHLYCTDNLEILHSMKDECIDLVVTDPPYSTGREFDDFTDTWESMSTYLEFMKLRLIEMYRVLKPSGTIYLQCDTNANHYLKVLMDDIFGINNFRNQIIWNRNTCCKNNTIRNLADDTDMILRYTKSKEFIWHKEVITVPYDMNNLDPKTQQQYRHIDNEGRRYALTSLVHPNKTHKTKKYEYKLMGITRTWRWNKERMNTAIAANKIIQTESGNVPRYKRYLDEQKGKMLNNIWTDIPNITPRHKEHLGYSTQKPLKLYERIIALSSNPTEIILDPFCGSGTTLAASKTLNRRYVGIDVNPKAISLSKKRLSEIAHQCQF